ncbi:MAG: hypothetical protein FWJ66_06105 [Caldibacillus sp.]
MITIDLKANLVINEDSFYLFKLYGYTNLAVELIGIPREFSWLRNMIHLAP